MIKVSYTLIALSCLAFVMAVVGSVFSYDFFGVDPEGISRASNNLALIAIVLVFFFKKE